MKSRGAEQERGSCHRQRRGGCFPVDGSPDPLQEIRAGVRPSGQEFSKSAISLNRGIIAPYGVFIKIMFSSLTGKTEFLSLSIKNRLHI